MGTRTKSNAVWAYGAGPEERRSRPRRPPSILGELAKLIVNIALLTGVVYGALSVLQLNASREVRVPRVRGLDRQAAERLLRNAGLTYTVIASKPSESIGAGKVLHVQPEGGRRVKTGRQVQLVISTGSEWTRVPDIARMSERRALDVLEGKTLTAGKRKLIYHATLPRGFVVAQYPPANTRVARESDVDMLISRGPRPGTDPDASPARTPDPAPELDAPNE